MKFSLKLENGEYKFVPDVENFGETGGMQPIVGAPQISTVGVSNSGITAPAMPANTTSAAPQAPNITINMPDNKPSSPVDSTKTGASLAPTAQPNEYQTKYEAMLNTQVAIVANELKGMGIADPDSIGKDVPPEQRLEILKAIKDNFVRAAPGVMPTNTQMGGNPAANEMSKEDKIADTMKKAGIDPKKYMQYFKE